MITKYLKNESCVGTEFNCYEKHLERFRYSARVMKALLVWAPTWVLVWQTKLWVQHPNGDQLKRHVALTKSHMHLLLGKEFQLQEHLLFITVHRAVGTVFHSPLPACKLAPKAAYPDLVHTDILLHLFVK